MNTLKILHLNTYDNFGGAAKGMYILHRALLEKDIDSTVLVKVKETQDASIFKLDDKVSLQNKMNLDNLPLQFYPKKIKSLISSAIIDSNEIIDRINTLQPDIVHLHWVCHSLLSIEDLSKINIPIIWTLRDVWPFTGGCHLPLDCQRYKIGCGECPILNSSDSKDITFQQMQRKIEAFKNSNITFVGISPWMKNEAETSILSSFCNEIVHINNNFDSNTFYPINFLTAQNNLNINTHKHIISIGANSFKSHHKGIKYFIEMLKYLNKEKFFLIFFGEEVENIQSLVDFEYKSFGFIQDTKVLREIYSLSSIFIAPSIHEPFGKTITEAMSCGTPVVCFENSGGPDMIISHKKDGYKAKLFDSQDLANGVHWILNSDYNSIAQAAIKKASNFSSEKIAQEYIELYKRKVNPIKSQTKIIQKQNIYENPLKIKKIQDIINDIKSTPYSKIIIYGYGSLGHIIQYHLKNRVLSFIDKDMSKIDNKLVFSPEDINKFDFDVIIISVLNRNNAIISYLQSLGIAQNKIICFE